MSEWKSGEPTEDGWYWAWDRSLNEVVPIRGMNLMLYAGYPDNEAIRNKYLWQGPLTPPEAPKEKADE